MKTQREVTVATERRASAAVGAAETSVRAALGILLSELGDSFVPAGQHSGDHLHTQPHQQRSVSAIEYFVINPLHTGQVLCHITHLTTNRTHDSYRRLPHNASSCLSSGGRHRNWLPWRG